MTTPDAHPRRRRFACLPSWRGLAPLILLLVLALAFPGCSATPGGALRVQSVTDRQTILEGGFDTGVYSLDSPDHVTIVLTAGPIESPTQAVTLRVFYRPRAALTPIDPNATNTIIQYLVFAGSDRQQVGVYSGAGYVYPRGTFGDESLRAAVWDGNLLLTDASASFKDLLGPALVRGKFTAKRDDLGTLDAIRKLGLMTSERLRYPRQVHAAPDPAGPLAQR